MAQLGQPDQAAELFSCLLAEPVDSFADLYADAGTVMLAAGRPQDALRYFRWVWSGGQGLAARRWLLLASTVFGVEWAEVAPGSKGVGAARGAPGGHVFCSTSPLCLAVHECHEASQGKAPCRPQVTSSLRAVYKHANKLAFSPRPQGAGGAPGGGQRGGVGPRGGLPPRVG